VIAGDTLSVTFLLGEDEQLGVVLVVVTFVICNICPLLALVRLGVVILAAPPALATTPLTVIGVPPFIV
jgi:hypothetical protein